MDAIVIATTKGREDWAADCLQSLGEYNGAPILVLNQYEYELGKIRWVYEHTDIDQFLFLQDSVIVKDYGWIDELFSHSDSVSLSHQPFFMYLGKYTREGLSKLGIPTIHTKLEAVWHEDAWTSRYASLNDVRTLWALHDTDVFEERHGRRNMVLENPHIVKYKGTWHPSMIID